MTIPTPAIFANRKSQTEPKSSKDFGTKPEPRLRPVKRRRGLSTHVDPDTLRGLRKMKGQKR